MEDYVWIADLHPSDAIAYKEYKCYKISTVSELHVKDREISVTRKE